MSFSTHPQPCPMVSYPMVLSITTLHHSASALTPYRCRVRHGPVLSSCLSFGRSGTALVLAWGLAHQLLGQELLEEWAVHVVNHHQLLSSRDSPFFFYLTLRPCLAAVWTVNGLRWLEIIWKPEKRTQVMCWLFLSLVTGPRRELKTSRFLRQLQQLGRPGVLQKDVSYDTLVLIGGVNHLAGDASCCVQVVE